MKKINVTLSEEHKKELENMSKELNISQTNLINMAVVSMLKNYEVDGAFVLVNLINPDEIKRKG